MSEIQGSEIQGSEIQASGIQGSGIQGSGIRHSGIRHSGIQGLAGVIISTSPARFAEMERFYGRVLGAHVRSRREGFVNFAWGGTRLTVTLHDGVGGESAEPARILVNLAVDDVDSMARLLDEIGAPIVREPEDESWGGRICTVADPDGNYLQFMQLQ